MAFCFLFFSTPLSYAWDPVTHWHINREANPEIKESNFDLYCDNGTGPDMFVMGDLCDYVHSPDLNREEDFAHKPNFAYLMLKARGLNNVSSSYYASGLGWGGHIAADWVAHDLELFPIPKSDKTDMALYGPPHLNGEFLYDYYMFLTRGPIKFPLWFKPKQIQKALVNYYLIDEHEKKPGLPDEVIKEYALTNLLSESEIKKRIVIFNCTVAALHATLASKTLVDISTGKTPFFLYNMRSRGAEENIALSVQTVRNWSKDLVPRNHIPFNEINPVRFYPLLPVPNIPEHLAYLPESRGFLDILSPFNTKFAWAEPLPGFNYAEEGPDSFHLTEATKYLFWLDVVEQAEQKGILQIEEKTELRDGEEWFTAEVKITDDELFDEIVKDEILEHIKNPSSTTDKKFAYFMRNFIVDQISDIDKLMDMTPPTISNLSPEDGSFINDSTPEIYAYLLDLPASGHGNENGIGIEEGSISLTLNGEDLRFTYSKETGALVAALESTLHDGEYEIEVKVSDKAGNETEKMWKFTIDTIPPEVDYEVLNKLINVKKETKAEIETTTNEPTTYLAEIFKVKDKENGNKGDAVFTYTNEEFSQNFTFTWDGRDDDGTLIKNGVYTIRITALDRAKNTTSFEEKVNVNNEAGGQVQKQQSQFLQDLRGGLSFLYSLFKDNS